MQCCRLFWLQRVTSRRGAADPNLIFKPAIVSPGTPLRAALSSQFEKPWQRAVRQANKLKQRLGIGVGIAEPLPDKPKGMWTLTYGGLLNKISQAEMLAYEARANRFQRLLAQVEHDIEQSSKSSTLNDRKGDDGN